MAYAVVIGEVVAAALAGMDEMRHELLLLEMLALADDPLGKGRELERVGQVSLRMLGVGMLGLIVYQVDEAAKRVTAVDVV